MLKPPLLFLSTLSLALATSCAAQEEDERPHPSLTEQWEPKVQVVEAPANGIPSDAIVLFDGSNLDALEHTNPDAENNRTILPDLKR